jgi:hypothetical protein
VRCAESVDDPNPARAMADTTDNILNTLTTFTTGNTLGADYRCSEGLVKGERPQRHFSHIALRE